MPGLKYVRGILLLLLVLAIWLGVRAATSRAATVVNVVAADRVSQPSGTSGPTTTSEEGATGCEQCQQRLPPQLDLVKPEQIPGIRVSTGTFWDSLWCSSHEIVSFAASPANLEIFDVITGKQTPLPLHHAATWQEDLYFIKNVRMSPDGHWLLWPGGDDEHPIWKAATLDGRAHREWPRLTRWGLPDVAWMQDSRHWAEVSEAGDDLAMAEGRPHAQRFTARVYGLDSPSPHVYPLSIDGPPAGLILPRQGQTGQFTFTQDGRAWIVDCFGHRHLGDPAWRDCSYADVYEIVSGVDGWTLHPTATILGPHESMGYNTDCVISPDDKWLVWTSQAHNDAGPVRILLCNRDGSDARVVFQTSGPFLPHNPQWTQNSRTLSFYWSEGRMDMGEMYRLPLDEVEAEDAPAENKSTGGFPVAAAGYKAATVRGSCAVSTIE